ncbi:hypothetical protein [Stenotrophomonas sp.]|uniref:hypothetical protein n=1 Tax=Stenotrophomonas sp. TaxID=69392 RepID=UPI00289BC62A|nr:hypothetical protein [Stenotrophomonas sp.]
MSGPKVVRIVTAEELLALREAMLHRLDQAVARWQAQYERVGERDASAVAAVMARRQALQALVADSDNTRYALLIEAETAFLQADTRDREARAVDRAAAGRQQRRRQRDNAAAVLKMLRDRAVDADAGLLQALRALADGHPGADAEAVLARAFALLAPPDAQATLSEGQRALAAALQTSAPIPTLADWATGQPADPGREARLLRVDRHIAELQVLQGAAAAAPYLVALHNAEQELAPQRRNLLLDSLVLDLAAATAAFAQRRMQLERLQDVASRLAALDPADNAPLLTQVAACSTGTALPLLTALTLQCDTALASHQQALAAVSRRQAVLDGLASLGYEVREGMATAWQDSGAVVLKKAATPGYGVEVGGQADGGRLQVRAVALAADRDRSRDRDIETLWCGEFGRLQALLHAQGTELVVERALGVGEVPLKEAIATATPSGQVQVSHVRSGPA